MNLVLDPERAVYIQALDNVHDTFARDIVVWKKSAQTIVSQNENFDAFSDQGISQIAYVTESKTFKACIKYIDRQKLESELNPGDGNASQVVLPMTETFQLARIKVNLEAYNYILSGAEKILLDGDSFEYILYTTARPHGLFSPKYYTIYLQSLP